MAASSASCLPSGYEDEFVSPVDEDFQCCICHLPLREPLQTICGHRFCRECIEEHLTRQEAQGIPGNCPVDRESLARKKDLFPDKATERKILSLFIKCPNEGCDWSGALREKQDHLAKCRKCPNSYGCTIKGEKSVSKLQFDLMCSDVKNNQMEMKNTISHLEELVKTLSKKQEEFNLQQLRLKARVDGLENENATLSQKVASQEKELSKLKDHEDRSVAFVWKIRNWDDIFDDATQNTEIMSEPFFSGRYGYKLRLSIKPSGNRSLKHTYMSVFLYTMVGEYDDSLTWPFESNVIVTLIDQQDDPDDRQNISVVICDVDSEDDFLDRPMDDCDDFLGCNRFVSHKILHTRNYIVDDTLFLQVKIS